MIVPVGKDHLTPAQENTLLDIEKAIKATQFSDDAHRRRFLDIQAKQVVRYLHA
jgi:hypothetical protein